MITILTLVATAGPNLLNAPANAQNSTNGVSQDSNTQVNSDYVLSYTEASAGVTTPVTIFIDQHLYYPGDSITVRGSVWSEIVTRVESLDLVKVEIKDGNGNVVARDDANVTSAGNYQTTLKLLDSAGYGTYTVESRVDLAADALGIVQSLTGAALQSSIQFAVADKVQHNISAGGENFTVWTASNSGLENVEFSQADKKLSFFVEGSDGTLGVTEITVPKRLLSGQMTVLMDQNILPRENVLLKIDNESQSVFEINYKHSIHRIEVAGTSVIPEFPLGLPMTMAAVLMMTLTVAFLKYRLQHY